jgi:uncharacterized protein (TIGR02996 family)
VTFQLEPDRDRMEPSADPEERAFQKAIRAKPDARAIRLVYADWLDERNDPRGELIRIEEETRTAAIYSDVYWELKPRRRELLKVVEKPWLKQMGYGGTDYQPVFADIPDGWKERWRLLREFVERWYQIPMDDVGGPLKPFPLVSRLAGDADARTMEEAMYDSNVVVRAAVRRTTGAPGDDGGSLPSVGELLSRAVALRRNAAF